MKYILTLLISTSVLFVGFSQLLETATVAHMHEKKSVDAYQITLDVEKSEAKSYWNDFVEDQNDQKIRGYGFFSKKDLLETDLAEIPAISNDPVKLFMEFKEVRDKTQLLLYAKNANGKYVSADKGKDKLTFTNLKRFGNRYLNYFLPLYYRDVIRDAEDRMEDAQKDLTKLASDIKKDEKRIKDLKEDIRSLESDIEKHKMEKDKAENKLTATRKTLKRKQYT